MSDEEELFKQMIYASQGGSVELLKSILSSVDNKSEFVQLVNKYGQNALHWAGNRKIATLLVETVEQSQRRAFILAVANSSMYGSRWNYFTALTTAVQDNIIDVAEYLCSLIPADEVLDTPSYPRYTPLHVAFSDHLAKLLVESVPEGRRLPFLLFPHVEDRRTALHEAVERDRAEIVEYLCSLNIRELVLHTDRQGNTALHLVRGETVAKLLIESLPDSLRKDFLLAVNNKGRTVIHEAAHRDVDDNDFVEILNISSKFLKEKESIAMKQDHEGKTPLHYARSVEIARALINQVQDKSAYVNMTDNGGRTALHAVNGGEIGWSGDRSVSEIAKLLIENAEDKSRYISLKDHHGQNVLHISSKMRIWYLIEQLLELLDDNDLASEVLPKMLVPDQFGNTPLHYLAARFNTQAFYRLCMLIPLWMRRKLMTQRREDGLTCLSILGQEERAIEYFMRDVFVGRTELPYCGWGSAQSFWVSPYPPEPNECLNNDVNLFKVMKCLLNEYSLLYGHQLLMRTFEQRVAEEVVGLVKPLWFYFDARELSWQDMHNRLYEIDTERHQGEPKVVVVTGYTSTPDKYLSPPGPDCIIISIIGEIPSGDLQQPQTTRHTDINEFLRCAQNMNGVQFLNVNSTMRRHYESSTKVDTDCTLVNDGCRGKAMIICYKTRRDQWKIEYDHAVNVLEKQLGLQAVKPSYDHDMSSEELEREIEKFSKSCVQSSLVVVCIMSHGDEEGNILCKDPKDVITVQKIADAFCKHLLAHVTKLLFLSFCRGALGLPRHNRTVKSWEDSVLPELSDYCNVVRRGVDPRKLEDARKTHPFPSVNMPPNCYILYSTLPDSKSFRYNARTGEANKMFEEMSSFLTDFHTRHSQTHDPETHSSHDPSAIDSRSLPLVAKDDQRSDSSSVDGTASAPHVELIYLFTEVASRVKHESQATQVLNFCYAIDKECKPVHVELPL